MKKKIALAVAILLVLIVGTVWALRGRANRQIEEVRQMQKEMFAQGKMPQPEQFENLKKKMDDLSPSQRDELGKKAMEDGQRHMEKMLNDYFDLPKEKRNDFLDQQIKDAEKNFKRWASAAPPKGQPPPQGQAPKGGGPKWSDEQRNQWRNNMLDRAPPESRARFEAWFTDMLARRKALGLPAFPGPPGPRTR